MQDETKTNPSLTPGEAEVREFGISYTQIAGNNKLNWLLESHIYSAWGVFMLESGKEPPNQGSWELKDGWPPPHLHLHLRLVSVFWSEMVLVLFTPVDTLHLHYLNNKSGKIKAGNGHFCTCSLLMNSFNSCRQYEYLIHCVIKRYFKCLKCALLPKKQLVGSELDFDLTMLKLSFHCFLYKV